MCCIKSYSSVAKIKISTLVLGLVFLKFWNVPGDQNVSCRPRTNAEVMSLTGQVHTAILIGCGTFCHVIFGCSSGSAITSLVRSSESDSSSLRNGFKKLVSIIPSPFYCVVFSCSSGIVFIISTKPLGCNPFQSLFTSVFKGISFYLCPTSRSSVSASYLRGLGFKYLP